MTITMKFTQLNQADQRNHIRLTMFDQIAQACGIAFALINPDGVVLVHNPLMSSWLDFSADLVGQNLVELLPELAGWGERITANFSEAFTLANICRSAPQQAETYFDLRIEPSIEPEQTWLVTLIDKTKEARLQQKLVQERNELRLSVSAREHTERERDGLIKQLESFGAMVAHNLKTPISNIIGSALLVNQHYDRLSVEDIKHFLESISQSGYKMNAMIDDLLLLAQVRPTEVERQPLEMTSIVEEALQRLQFMVRDLQARIHIPDAWPAALGYAPWVVEIWANYLSNGLKYGGLPPRLELGATPQNDGSVRFWVKDNGAGLTPEDCARLFTEFARLGQTDVEGHGLGLSIVKQIVTKLGGEVGVESQPGEGSIFSFTLPVA